MTTTKASFELRAINDLKRHVESVLPDLHDAVNAVVKSGWYVHGNAVRTFESQFAQYCGVSHCVGVGNGTDALELSLKAIDVGPEDKVVTVANAGMYSTSAILAVGALPVYVDVDPDTMLIDHRSLEEVFFAESPKAMIVTHLYGRMANMHHLLCMAQAAKVRVVEDCAQAHGAIQDGRKAGSFGDLGCFSFYPTKNLGGLGDGGAVVTADGELAKRIRSLRQYGWVSKYDSRVPGGRNSRLDEIQAAVLSAKLPHLDRWNERRREIARKYGSSIRNPRVVCPGSCGSDFVAHLYVVRTANAMELQGHLRSAGVPSETHYPIPDHRQAILPPTFQSVQLPNTEELCKSILTLPCFPEMTTDEVEYVAETTNSW